MATNRQLPRITDKKNKNKTFVRTLNLETKFVWILASWQVIWVLHFYRITNMPVISVGANNVTYVRNQLNIAKAFNQQS